MSLYIGVCSFQGVGCHCIWGVLTLGDCNRGIVIYTEVSSFLEIGIKEMESGGGGGGGGVGRCLALTR